MRLPHGGLMGRSWKIVLFDDYITFVCKDGVLMGFGSINDELFDNSYSFMPISARH